MDQNLRENIDKVKEIIDTSEKIYISSHMNPDGDSIGSIIAFGSGLKSLYPDKNIEVVIRDPIPSYLDFLDSSIVGHVKHYESADLLFLLDCGDKDRTGIDGIENIEKIINIDHHITNPLYGHINMVYGEASSTCEIIYNILCELGANMENRISRALYTGLSSDTGSFKYRNTGPKTHKIAGEILSTGINTEDIVMSLYQSNTINQVTLIKEAIENMDLYRDNTIAMLLLTDDILKKANMGPEDADSIVEFLRDIDTVQISCVFKRYESKVKISLRSKDRYDVSEIAKKFGGGGHMRAAGCRFEGSMEEAKKLLLEEIIQRS